MAPLSLRSTPVPPAPSTTAQVCDTCLLCQSLGSLTLNVEVMLSLCICSVVESRWLT
jgi:hypothetical protein